MRMLLIRIWRANFSTSRCACQYVLLLILDANDSYSHLETLAGARVPGAAGRVKLCKQLFLWYNRALVKKVLTNPGPRAREPRTDYCGAPKRIQV